MKAGSDKSRKWLHALQVQPRSHVIDDASLHTQMTQEELTRCEGLVTDSPVEAVKRSRDGGEEGGKRNRGGRREKKVIERWKCVLVLSGGSECREAADRHVLCWGHV